MKGEQLEGIAFRHPLYERDSVGVLADYVTLEAGHRRGAHGAGARRRRLPDRQEATAWRSTRRSVRAADFLDTVEPVRRPARVRRQPQGRAGAARARAAVAPGDVRSTSTRTAGAATTRSSSSPRRSGSSAWTATPVITGEDGATRTLREAAQPRHRPRGEVDPGVGPRPHLQHGDQPAGLVHLAPARLGRADSGRRLHVVRRGAADARAHRQGGGGVRAVHSADAWYERPIEEFLPDGPRRARRAAARRSSASATSSTSGSTPARATRRCCRATTRAGLAGRHVPRRAATSTAAGSRARCWWRWPHARRPPYREVLTHGFLIDLEGRKMSKSVGNVIAPQEVIKESGAEIIRLWVAMTRVHRGAARQQGDPDARRRRLPQAAQHLPHPRRQPLRLRPGDRQWCRSSGCDAVDRFALARYADAARGCAGLRGLRLLDRRAGAEHAGHGRPERVLRRRDQGPDVHARRASHERRSTQTAMYLICDGLARLLAPILPVTADDAVAAPAGPALSVGAPRRLRRRRAAFAEPGAGGHLGRGCSACAKRSTPRSSRSARTR